MNDKVDDKTLDYTIEDISERYGLTHNKATEIVNSSWFPKQYSEMPDLIKQHSIKYWSDNIMETYLTEIVQKKYVTQSYNCKTITLTLPHNFLTMNAQTSDTLEYKNIPIEIDSCISDEIQDLWAKGIHTTGCCCGHGIHIGFIQVENEDISKMEELGYEHYLYPKRFGGENRKDAFVPKTGYKHNVNRETPYIERCEI